MSCDHFDDVKAGTRRAEDVRTLFFAQLDGDLVAPKNGFISRRKMVDLYEDLSGGYAEDQAGDDRFAFDVRSTWNFWNMRGFEPRTQATTKKMVAEAADDWNDDANDARREEDDFGYAGGGGSSGDQESVRSDASPRPAGKSPRSRGPPRPARGGGAGAQREPVPWECASAWTHDAMRTSLSAMAHKPLPRVGAHRLIGSGGGGSGQEEEKAAAGGEGALPPHVFGDLSAVLRGGDVLPLCGFLPPQDHWETLRRLFYAPPCSFQAFCRSLGLSGVEASPLVTGPCLASRVFEAGKRSPHLVAARPLSSALLPRSGKAGGGASGQGARWSQRSAEAVARGALADASEARVVAGKSSLPAAWVFDELARLFGVAKGKRANSVIERVRGTLLDTCGPLGLGELRRQLQLMDVDGSGALDPAELKAGLGKMGLFLNAREVEEVFWEFDKDRSGAVDHDEFMQGVRGGPLGGERLALVEAAWDRVSEGRGGLAVDDVLRAFDCEWCPSAAAFFHAKENGGGGGGRRPGSRGSHQGSASGYGGSRQCDEATRPPWAQEDRGGGGGAAGACGAADGGPLFGETEAVDPGRLAGGVRRAFELGFGHQDRAWAGEVTEDDFLQFHSNVSATVDGDRVFEAFVRNTWHVSA